MKFEDPFKSKILGNHLIMFMDLINLPQPSNWNLIYRASADGFGADNFHSKCDGKSPTLVIIKALGTGFVFGGYTEATWEGFEMQKCDPNAFIFSLTNRDKKPIKLQTTKPELSIFCSPFCGPSFGSGEIHIENNANYKNDFDSFSILGDVFMHPQYSYGTNNANSLLAGSGHFLVGEIEVYEKL
jgi:hypothetical protein